MQLSSDPKQIAKIVAEQLKKEYPEVETPLLHSNVFELLVATILSPQTTDEVTNKVTPLLFAKYNSPEILANANIEDVEKIIKVLNYYKTKARNLIKTARMLIDKFDSKVPHTLQDLLTLPGVGRKIGNVIISEWYGKKPTKIDSKNDMYSTIPRGTLLPEGFVVDTHVLRVTRQMGLTKNEDPKKVEQDLMKLFPREEWNDMSLRFIFHGRQVNQARNPKYHEHPFWSKFYKGTNVID